MYVQPVRILDLFCGAGGVARGYADAGFEVTGVDIKRQKNYPYEFHHSDALQFVMRSWDWIQDNVDAIHASPPCQEYSVTRHVHAYSPVGRAYPKLVPDVQRLLRETGKPYIIENVVGAPLADPITICGCHFWPEIQVRRHRLFECNWPCKGTPHGDHALPYLLVFGNSVQARGHVVHRNNANGGPTVKRRNLRKADGQRAMGIDWMTVREMSESVPPVYTRWIGEQLADYLASEG